MGKNERGHQKMNEKVVNAALLGLGTVGTGVYKVIRNQEQEMTAKLGCQVKITKILVRNLEKAVKKVEDPSILTTNWDDIAGDPSIDIVIELIGGIEPARTYILSALKAGKNVVTANKDLIAVHGKELLDAAQASHVDLLFEAAVAGSIAIIRPLKQCLAGNHMSEVMGIVNGTTNFILTKMSQEAAECELEKTNAAIEAVTGKKTEYMRPPYGAWKKEMEEKTGMMAVLWNVDPLDWNTDNETEIVNKVVTETEENDIILLHDCYLSSAKAALRIIDIMQAKGYEFVTVDELLLD